MISLLKKTYKKQQFQPSILGLLINPFFISRNAIQVLEHVSNPSKIISEIARVLKPNGKPLLTVPLISDEHEQPYDFFRYTSFGLEKLFTENKLEIAIHKRLNSNIALVCTHLWVTYLYKLTKTKFAVVSLCLTPILFFPFNLIGLFFSFILPSKKDLFLDSFIIAKNCK